MHEDSYVATDFPAAGPRRSALAELESETLGALQDCAAAAEQAVQEAARRFDKESASCGNLLESGRSALCLAPGGCSLPQCVSG